eukprot:TRINITY_DN3682_c0_g1_i1.p2 TRINITY_DN3682_c0_g1~~TRINITY_DN3682_c0_g1_i1.p2  ORF type:complete len:348 (+),score=70.04 TRINITY_DN3682_c0_g1_i1:796-1839(+)
MKRVRCCKMEVEERAVVPKAPEASSAVTSPAGAAEWIVVPELFKGFLPELWDYVFNFGWYSEFKSFLMVSRYFHAIFWHHLKHLDFSGEVPTKTILKTFDKCHPNALQTLQITSYGTLHIDPAPEKLKQKLFHSNLLGLTSLSIQRWSLSPSDLTSLHLPSLTHLTLISSSSAAAEPASLPAFPDLRSLTLRFVTESLLQSIQSFTSLVTLNVGNLSEIRQTTNETIEYTSKNGREVSDATFHYILNFPNLTELNLSGLSITDKSLARLSQLGSLRKLSVTWCQKVTDCGLAQLSPLANLTEVEAWHSGITAEGVSNFLHARRKEKASALWEPCRVSTACVNRVHDL